MDKNQLLEQIRELKAERRPNSITAERMGDTLEKLVAICPDNVPDDRPRVMVKTLDEWMTDTTPVPRGVPAAAVGKSTMVVGNGFSKYWELIPYSVVLQDGVPVKSMTTGQDRRYLKCQDYEGRALSDFYIGNQSRTYLQTSHGRSPVTEFKLRVEHPLGPDVDFELLGVHIHKTYSYSVEGDKIVQEAFGMASSISWRSSFNIGFDASHDVSLYTEAIPISTPSLVTIVFDINNIMK